MKAKMLVSTLAAVVFVPFAASSLSAEPGSHDHQATKTHIARSASSKNEPTEKCAPKGDMDVSDEAKDVNAKESESEKCAPKKDAEKLHDHRKMKNL